MTRWHGLGHPRPLDSGLGEWESHFCAAEDEERARKSLVTSGSELGLRRLGAAGLRKLQAVVGMGRNGSGGADTHSRGTSWRRALLSERCAYTDSCPPCARLRQLGHVQ